MYETVRWVIVLFIMIYGVNYIWNFTVVLFIIFSFSFSLSKLLTFSIALSITSVSYCVAFNILESFVCLVPFSSSVTLSLMLNVSLTRQIKIKSLSSCSASLTSIPRTFCRLTNARQPEPTIPHHPLLYCKYNYRLTFIWLNSSINQDSFPLIIDSNLLVTLSPHKFTQQT